MSELEGLLDAALELADLAKALSAEAWCSEMPVRYKPDGSPVTDADEGIETR